MFSSFKKRSISSQGNKNSLWTLIFLLESVNRCMLIKKVKTELYSSTLSLVICYNLSFFLQSIYFQYIYARVQDPSLYFCKSEWRSDYKTRKLTSELCAYSPSLTRELLTYTHRGAWKMNNWYKKQASGLFSFLNLTAEDLENLTYRKIRHKSARQLWIYAI